MRIQTTKIANEQMSDKYMSIFHKFDPENPPDPDTHTVFFYKDTPVSYEIFEGYYKDGLIESIVRQEKPHNPRFGPILCWAYYEDLFRFAVKEAQIDIDTLGNLYFC